MALGAATGYRQWRVDSGVGIKQVRKDPFCDVEPTSARMQDNFALFGSSCTIAVRGSHGLSRTSVRRDKYSRVVFLNHNCGSEGNLGLSTVNSYVVQR